MRRRTHRRVGPRFLPARARLGTARHRRPAPPRAVVQRKRLRHARPQADQALAEGVRRRQRLPRPQAVLRCLWARQRPYAIRPRQPHLGLAGARRRGRPGTARRGAQGVRQRLGGTGPCLGRPSAARALPRRASGQARPAAVRPRRRVSPLVPRLCRVALHAARLARVGARLFLRRQVRRRARHDDRLLPGRLARGDRACPLLPDPDEDSLRPERAGRGRRTALRRLAGPLVPRRRGRRLPRRQRPLGPALVDALAARPTPRGLRRLLVPARHAPAAHLHRPQKHDLSR